MSRRRITPETARRMLAQAYTGETPPCALPPPDLSRQRYLADRAAVLRTADEMQHWSERLAGTERSLAARELSLQHRREEAEVWEWQLREKAGRLARWEHALVGCSVAVGVMLLLLLVSWGLHR